MAKKQTAPETGPRLNEAWSTLLAENEARKKSGKTPWTDVELTERITKQFPDKKGKTTLTRVSMIRSIYNKGTNLFEKFGPAGKGGRPMSHPYNPQTRRQEQAKKVKRIGDLPDKPPADAPAPKKKLVLRRSAG